MDLTSSKSIPFFRSVSSIASDLTDVSPPHILSVGILRAFYAARRRTTIVEAGRIPREYAHRCSSAGLLPGLFDEGLRQTGQCGGSMSGPGLRIPRLGE
jgi:hypothetical protein